jgi:hypothetical protein
MTMGFISSTSIKSAMLLQVDIEAALSKYHGVFDVEAEATRALSEVAMAQRAESLGGRNVEDRDEIAEMISGGWETGDDVQWPKYCMKHS